MKNPFIILECQLDASKDEIDKQFKKLAMKYHPDRNTKLKEPEKKQREETFKELNCAYQYMKKNNYKYTEQSNKDYSKFSDIFKSRFFNNTNKFYGVFNNLKNLNFDSLADNMLKGITTIQDIYDNNDDKLEKVEDICINANIDIFDIYNGVNKEIKIDLVKKCQKCMCLGYDINTKLVCENCQGKKVINTKQTFEFNSIFKTITFKGEGNEEIGKRAGNVYINLSPKDDQMFSIINNYDILYRYFIDFDDIIDDDIIHTIKYLDLKEYELRIEQLASIKRPFYHYYQIILDDYGLYYPDGNGRGKLVIDIYDYQGILNTLNKVKNENMFTFSETN